MRAPRKKKQHSHSAPFPVAPRASPRTRVRGTHTHPIATHTMAAAALAGLLSYAADLAAPLPPPPSLDPDVDELDDAQNRQVK